MSLKKYTYNDNIYYINPDKINYLIHGQSLYPVSAFAKIGSSLFTFLFDNQKSLSINFNNYIEGKQWVEDNFINPPLVGETSPNECHCEYT
jgi:hypothetical protein